MGRERGTLQTAVICSGFVPNWLWLEKMSNQLILNSHRADFYAMGKTKKTCHAHKAVSHLRRTHTLTLLSFNFGPYKRKTCRQLEINPENSLEWKTGLLVFIKTDLACKCRYVRFFIGKSCIFLILIFCISSVPRSFGNLMKISIAFIQLFLVFVVRLYFDGIIILFLFLLAGWTNWRLS